MPRVGIYSQELLEVIQVERLGSLRRTYESDNLEEAPEGEEYTEKHLDSW